MQKNEQVAPSGDSAGASLPDDEGRRGRQLRGENVRSDAGGP